MASSHPTEVEGYKDELQLLCQCIHAMRYDRVEEFYRCCAVELYNQATADRLKGRELLADLLEKSARLSEQQQRMFALIFERCKPYMSEEIGRDK